MLPMEQHMSAADSQAMYLKLSNSQICSALSLIIGFIMCDMLPGTAA